MLILLLISRKLQGIYIYFTNVIKFNFDTQFLELKLDYVNINNKTFSVPL